MNVEQAKLAFASGDISAEAYIDILSDENNRIKSERSAGGALRLKVSEKGALSIYGLGRFPVTLYKEQWNRVFGHQDEIKAFMSDNANKFATDEDKQAYNTAKKAFADAAKKAANS